MPMVDRTVSYRWWRCESAQPVPFQELFWCGNDDGIGSANHVKQVAGSSSTFRRKCHFS